ncbi:MAG: hypothetical protein L6V85_03185 [Clostridiales bacterium]|nr:MAG: hypothetical protein L6V85_03185 [Clostridiales bacterium]
MSYSSVTVNGAFIDVMNRWHFIAVFSTYTSSSAPTRHFLSFSATRYSVIFTTALSRIPPLIDVSTSITAICAYNLPDKLSFWITSVKSAK